MKRTGIILELNQKQAVVMANDAEFITIKRKPGMYTGAPVELNPPVHAKFAFLRFKDFAARARNPRTAGLAGLTVAVVLIVAFVLSFYTPIGHYQDQYAYVTVDINPSVEFILDTNITVTDVRSLNDDARTLLQGESLLNRPLAQALLTLVNRAEQKKYFASATEKYILVSTVTENIAGKPELLESSISQCNTELETRNIQMQYIQATLSQRKTALENHLSTGRYALMDYAQDYGQKIGLEAAKTRTVGGLLAASGLLKNSSETLIAQNTATKVSENSPPGTLNVRPTNSTKQALAPSGNFALDQTGSKKLTPALSNPFIVSSGANPTLTTNGEVAVTPKLYPVSADDTRLAAAIASVYRIHVSGQDIAGLRENQSLGYGEIGLLYGLANAAGKTVADILAIRQSGLSWNEIAGSLGVKISAITRKNSAVLKKAGMAQEAQKIKAQLKQEEKEAKEKNKPIKADQGTENGNSKENKENGGNGGHGNKK